MESPTPKPADDSERRKTSVSQSSGEKRPRRGDRPSRRAPFLRLFAFYALMAGLAVALVFCVRSVREAWEGEAAAEVQRSTGFTQGGQSIAPAVADRRMIDRSVIMLLITLSSLASSLPVAWTYTYT